MRFCETCQEWDYQLGGTKHRCPKAWYGVVRRDASPVLDQWDSPHEVRARDAESAAEKIAAWWDRDDPYLGRRPEDNTIEIMVCEREDGDGERLIFRAHARLHLTYHAEAI